MDFLSVFDEQASSAKRYFCQFEGCGKSYSTRQNRHRHKMQDHSVKVHLKPTYKHEDSEAAMDRETAASLHRERELLIESFSLFQEQVGEEHATAYMMNNKKLKDHLVPLRKMMEVNIANRLSDASESESIVEKQLTEFKNTISSRSAEEVAAFQAVINLAKNATSDSFVHLQQFTVVLKSLTSHAAEFSESVNPKLQQARALKNVLDQLFSEAMTELHLPALPVSPSADRKRKVSQMCGEFGYDCDNVGSNK